jgi:hypothetical protein
MFRKQKVKPYDRQAVLGVLPFELKAKILRHLYAGVCAVTAGRCTSAARQEQRGLGLSPDDIVRPSPHTHTSCACGLANAITRVAGAIRDVPLLREIAGDDLFMTDVCIRLQPYTCCDSTFVYQRGVLCRAWQHTAGSRLLAASAPTYAA